MTGFDLLFVAAFLAFVATLAVVVVRAVRGRRREAFRLLRGAGIAAAVYLAVGLIVSAITPRRVVAVGAPWCFDDWCLSVSSVDTTRGTDGVRYTIGLRLESRARRVAQRAKGAWIYLIDARGRRYAPEPDSAAVPLDVLLLPGQSMATSRVFQVPAGVRQVGLITGHGGPYCGAMAFLVIGQAGCVFHKPAMIAIDRLDR